jgi:hypothetical protein
MQCLTGCYNRWFLNVFSLQTNLSASLSAWLQNAVTMDACATFQALIVMPEVESSYSNRRHASHRPATGFILNYSAAIGIS